MRGFELWRDEVNAAGGIKAGGKQYKINFVSYDDESQNTRVQQLYTRLIVQDKAQFLFSPYSSGLVATAAIISEQYGKVMLTTGGAEEKTYRLGNKNLFQVYSPAGQYLAGALAALKEKNPKAQIAFVYKDDPFSKAVAQATRDLAKQDGLDARCSTNPTAAATTDFGPIINKIISSKADALLGGGHYPDGATLARQLHDQKAGLKWVTLLVAPDSPKFAELGDAAVGISVPSQWEPQVTFKPDFGPDRAGLHQDASPTNTRSSPAITRPAATRRACSCSTPSSRPARSTRPRSPTRSTRWTSPPCSAAPSSRPIRRSTGCSSGTRWCWRSGRRRAARWSRK